VEFDCTEFVEYMKCRARLVSCVLFDSENAWDAWEYESLRL